MKNIGTFYNKQWIYKWWELISNSNDLNTMEINNDIFANGMILSGSTPFDHYEYQMVYPITPITVKSGEYYTLTAKFWGDPHEKLIPNLPESQWVTSSLAQLKVYVSGSGINQILPPGKLVKTFTNEQTKNYGEVNIDFFADNDGEVTPLFQTNAGRWIIADVSFRNMQYDGFSPNQFTYYTEIPTWARNDDLNFKIELYDTEGNKAPIDLINGDNTFTGSNLYIEGDDNLQSGSMYLGNKLFSGIESSGRGSGYYRSYGYKGWESASLHGAAGFMLFSGSVLPEETQSAYDQYTGVGLELHDGLSIDESSYFRFRTNPSLLEVVTDKFFFGRQNSMYISGSDGIIEISSSNFLLSSSGDVLVSGTIYANSGSIGGWQILGDKLQSTNNNMMLSGSGVISSSNFYVTEEGDMTGSQVLFTGGKIGGWDILPDRLEKYDYNEDLQAGLYVGMSTIGDYVFYAGSTTSESIENANFTVDKAGRVTASTGRLGAWSLDTRYISSSNIAIDGWGAIGTSNYIPDFQGWRIDSTGFAEFNNARIRGTLSTTVFEKDTINAVGGQLWVANSTVLSASAIGIDEPYSISDTETTWSIAENVGFIEGEILIVKRVTDTGFSEEYVQVDGTGSLNYPYELYVTRSLNDISSSYQQGQVIVSTGRIGTGYILVNANPGDESTPYIDVRERFGIGYENDENINIIARLGDLSGLSSVITNYDSNNPYGLYTQNGYFEGAIIARTGSFSGIVHAGNLLLGMNVLNAHDGISFGDNENYWVTSGSNNEVSFSLGGINGITYVSGGKVEIGSDVNISGSITASSGIIGGWEILEDKLLSANNNMMLSGSGVISSSNFYVSEGGDLSASNAYFDGAVFIGGELTSSAIYPSTGSISGWEIAEGLLRNNSDTFRLEPEGDYIISSSRFKVSQLGDVSGSQVLFTGGNISGWEINTKEIYKDNIYLSSESSSLFVINNQDRAIVSFGSGSEKFRTDITGSNIIISGSFEGEKWWDAWYVTSSDSTIITGSRTDESAYLGTYSFKVSSGSDSLEKTFLTNKYVYFTQSAKWDSGVIDSDTSIIMIFNTMRKQNWNTSSLGTQPDYEFNYNLYMKEVGGSFEEFDSGVFTIPYSSWGNKVITNGAPGSNYDELKLEISCSVLPSRGIVSASDIDDIYFDNFKVYTTNAYTKLTQEGLLVYNSPYQYIKATQDGLDIKGGDIELQKLTTQDLEVYGDVSIFGGFEASSIPPYNSTPQSVVIPSEAAEGTVTSYARGNHKHGLDINVFLVGQSGEINVVDNGNGTATLSSSFSSSMAERLTNEEITSSALISDFDYVQSLGENDNVEFANISSSEDLYVSGTITFPTLSYDNGIVFTNDSGILENTSSLTWDGEVFSIEGKLEATSKSFVIKIPDTDKKLEYGVSEGPEHSVFCRGELKNNYIIELPKEWEWLINNKTITIQLTSIGKFQELYVDRIENNKIYIGISGMFNSKKKIHCYYYIQAERKDIDKLNSIR
jgi:hypothetical protein